MPTIDPIDHPARLDEMAAQLFRQGRDPALHAADATVLRGAAAEIRRLRGRIDELAAIIAEARCEIDDLVRFGLEEAP